MTSQVYDYLIYSVPALEISQMYTLQYNVKIDKIVCRPFTK